MIKEAIKKLVEQKDLTRQEMVEVMDQIMSGNATAAQIGAFLTALRLKGETAEEITGAAMVMREKATNINVRGEVDIDREEINEDEETILDTCGTGGGGTNTFNISTAAAFVIAGCGIKVAKHGNRAVSSQCGSADVLQTLGVNLDIPPLKVAQCIREVGIGFMYAPLYHEAMKHAIGPRREIGIRTIFNLLGPLTNPAKANTQVLGVYDAALTETIAAVLRNLGTRRAFIVHGKDTIDEVSITGATKITELKNKQIKTSTVKPQDFGLKCAKLADIKGGTNKENAAIIIAILENHPGPKRDVVILNAAFALVAAGKAKNVKAGIGLAQAALASGRAKEKLESLIEFTNR